MRNYIIVVRFFVLVTLGGALVLPFGVSAFERGSVSEDFVSTGRRQERTTFAFWDTKGGEASLPLQYTFSAMQGTLPASEARIRFQDVTSEFSRIPQGKIRSDAPVVSDMRFRFALAGSTLYTSLGDGIALTAERIPELKGRTISTISTSAIASQTDRLMLGGRFAGKSFVAELVLVGFAPSAPLETKALAQAGSGKVFEKTTLGADAELPEGTHIEYFLSSDGGLHWESVTAGIEHTFIHQGSELRFRAVLFTDAISKTPALRKITVDFVKDEVETVVAIRSQDSRRISDLKSVAASLERFRRERGVYPIVDGESSAVRFSQLGELLIDGKFLSKMPQDPRYEEDRERRYDYISGKSGDAYLLRARLQEIGSKRLEKDVDGKPVEPFRYEYTCDDPWYCEGKGFVVTPPPPAFPEPRGTAEVLKGEDGKVWRIATVGGGPRPIEKQKLYIPSSSLLTTLSNFYALLQRAPNEIVASYRRVRLVKTADKNDVYYITETFLKRRLTSWEVFRSYGNDPQEIAIVQPEELAAYGESRLIRLVGDTRVWYLEGGGRRLVKSPAIMQTHGFKFSEVAPANFPEYNSYPEGTPLE